MIVFVNLAESSAGVINLHSSCPNKLFGEIFFSKNRNFYHHFCSSKNNFATWQVENGGFIESDFLLCVVSLEKFFIFQIDVFPIDSVLLAEKSRQGFWNWFLRIFGAALTKFTVFAKLTFVWPVWVSSIKIGVWCSSFYHFETMSQKITFFSGGKHSAGSSTLQFRCPDEIFDENWSLEKITKFHPFRIVGEKFWLSTEKSWQHCRNHILRVQEIGLTRVCFFSNDFLKLNSRSWFESIGTFDDTFLAVLLNLHSICQKDSLGKIFYWWNCIRFCNRLWTMSKYKWPLGVTNLCFLYFWRKSLVFLEEIWWFSRTEFQPSKGSLWRKY